MTRAEAREQRAKRLAQRRVDERACALDFLTWGDEQGVHAKRCVYRGTSTPTCDRNYHPGPMPDDESLYRGTGIGALYGGPQTVSYSHPDSPIPTTRSLVADLAGWNITRRKDAE